MKMEKVKKTSEELKKLKQIKAEVRRLKALFKEMPADKLKVVESLINTAAFINVSLRELEEIINVEGYTVEYQNGENQFGTKQSDNVKSHIAMVKNQSMIIKQLTDLMPDEVRKTTRLEAFKNGN